MLQYSAPNQSDSRNTFRSNASRLRISRAGITLLNSVLNLRLALQLPQAHFHPGRILQCLRKLLGILSAVVIRVDHLRTERLHARGSFAPPHGPARLPAEKS